MFSGGKVMTKSKEVKFEMLLIAIMLLLFLRINHSAGKASLLCNVFLLWKSRLTSPPEVQCLYLLPTVWHQMTGCNELSQQIFGLDREKSLTVSRYVSKAQPNSTLFFRIFSLPRTFIIILKKMLCKGNSV